MDRRERRRKARRGASGAMEQGKRREAFPHAATASAKLDALLSLQGEAANAVFASQPHHGHDKEPEQIHPEAECRPRQPQAVLALVPYLDAADLPPHSAALRALVHKDGDGAALELEIQRPPASVQAAVAAADDQADARKHVPPRGQVLQPTPR